MGTVAAQTGEVLAQESISDRIFLIPNGTIIYELILFSVVFWIFAKFIVPPIRQALTDREERVRQTQRDNEEADQRYAEAKRRHDEVLAEARSSASSIRDEARASGRETADGIRGEAEREVATKREQGERELAQQRSRAREQVNAELPSMASTLAERILGRSLSDPAARRATTDEYLASIGESSGAATSGVTAASTSSVAGSSGRSEES